MQHLHRLITGEADLFPPFPLVHVNAGSVLYPPGGTFGPRVQPDVQLIIVRSGEMRVQVGGRDVDAPAGYVTMQLPGRTEQFWFARDRETWHQWIALHFAMPAPDIADWLSTLPEKLPLSDKMLHLTDWLLGATGEDASADRLVKALALSALQLYAWEANAQSAQVGSHPSVIAAKQHVELHFHEELSLRTLAGRAHVTEEHLVRLFRKQLGCTPMQYVWDYRVRQGLQLLQHSGLTVAEIALRCGFKSAFHFSRLIKQKSGLSPTAYRRLRLKGPPADRG